MTRETNKIPGDPRRFARPTSFIKEGTKIEGAENLKRSDPDYILKKAALAGATISFKPAGQKAIKLV